jgi:imidazoleglycerol-phosphate dehydratase
MTDSGSPRAADIERSTKETRIRLNLALDGTGTAEIATGIGFLDHMLELLARHARLNLSVNADGDLQTGAHHTTEDVGICLGQALDRALGDRRGVMRYGDAMVPMDEALAASALDLSGRPFCAFDSRIEHTTIAGFETELVEEFFRAISNNARLTLHLQVLEGSNAHHKIEACFKAFARALREAVSVDGSEAGVPSTKGVL